MNQRVPLLEIRDLCLDFVSPERTVRALDGVSFDIAAGETVCLVGESGSGKSITALSIARLLPSPPAHYVSGRILVQGQDVLRLAPSALQQLRGGVVSYIFQEPSASLNPVMRVGRQILESLALHRPPEAATDDESLDALTECCRNEGILPAIESAHALSGARAWAKKNPGKKVLIGLSGRGDKDMPTLQRTVLADTKQNS